jgi:hypothetical protein
MSARVRPGLRRLAILAAIVLLPIAAHTLWDYIELQRVIREIKAIQARNEPVTERQAGLGYKKLSPDEDLSARLYSAAATLAYPTAAEARELIPSLVAQTTDRETAALDRKALEDRVATALAGSDEALRLADRANALPFSRFSPGYEYNYQTSELLRLLELEWLRAAHMSVAGKGDAAIVALRDAIVARRIVRDDVLQWASSAGPDTAVGLALSYANASADALGDLEAFLTQRVSLDTVRQHAMADRASFIEMAFRQLYSGDPSAPETAGTQPRGRGIGVMGYVWRPWLSRKFIAAIQKWNELVDASALPWPDRARAMDLTYGRLAAEQQRKVSTEDQAPPAWWSPRWNLMILRVLPRTFHQLVLDRVAAVAVAVARFRSENGHLPASLNEVAVSSRAEFVDPWSGQALRFRTDSASFTVYSIGPDSEDDGGAVLVERRPTGYQRGMFARRSSARDIGIRVLLNPK